MRTRKLYDLLSRISIAERKDFAEFLRSPLHSHRPKLAELVELMEEILFRQPEAQVSHEDFHRAYYPGKAYDANNLNRLISNITTEFKQYLGLLAYKRDRAAQMANTVREYGRRHWNDLIPGEVELARKQMKEVVHEDEHYFYQMARVEYELILHKVATEKTGDHPYFQPYLDFLDRFTLHTKSRALVATRQIDIRYHQRHTNRWREISSSSDSIELRSRHVGTDLFSKIAELDITEFSLADFNSLRKEASEATSNYVETSVHLAPQKLSRDDADLVFNFLIFYLSKRFTDREFYFQELVSITQEQLEKGVCFEDGELQAAQLIAFARTLTIKGDFESAISETKRLSEFVPIKDREIMLLHVIGYVKFLCHENQMALRSLLAVKNLTTTTSNFKIILDSRLLLCITWYRQDDIEAVFHELAAIRAMIARRTYFTNKALPTYKRFVKVMQMVERAERRSGEARIKRLALISSKLTPKTSFTMMPYVKAEIDRRILTS